MDLSELKYAFTDDPVSLLDALDLEYRQRGTRLEVLCPFHSDIHLGNAVINNGYFYCFACNSKADVVELTNQVNNCNFMTSVNFICSVYGLKCDNTPPEKTVLSLTGKERVALAFPKTPISVNRLTESDKKRVYLKRIEVMIPKYEEIIRLYGNADADEAWKLAELCNANTVTFSKIKREAENRIKILRNLKSRITK